MGPSPQACGEPGYRSKAGPVLRLLLKIISHCQHTRAIVFFFFKWRDILDKKRQQRDPDGSFHACKNNSDDIKNYECFFKRKQNSSVYARECS